MAQQKTDWISQLITFILVAIIAIIAVVIAVIYIASIIAPIFIIGAFIVFTVRYRKTDIANKHNSFWLYPGQIKDFKDCVRNYNLAARRKDEIQVTVEREGIAINMNGRISARSYRGKALQAELDNIHYTIEESQKYYDILRNLPRHNYKRAKRNFSMSFGLGAAIIPWLILSFCLIMPSNTIFPEVPGSAAASDSTEIAVQTPSEAETDTEEKNEIPFLAELGAATIPTAITSLVVWFVAWLMALIYFRIRNRKPPVVTMDNVDIYLDHCQKKHDAEDAKKKEKTVIPQINTWKKEGWIFNGLTLSCSNGNPGSIKVSTDGNRWFFIATYLDDPDFSNPLCKEMGGTCYDGKWWKCLPEQYNNLPEGYLISNFYTDKDLQKLIIDTFDQIRTILERHNRTYQWKTKTGSHEGWSFFIWQWDVLACQKHSSLEGNPFMDVIYDESSQKAIITFSNRNKDINLVKQKLKQMGCSEKPLNSEGRVLLDEIASPSADAVAEKINYWIQKLD